MIRLNHACADAALWLAKGAPLDKSQPLDSDWLGWARHWGDGRNWWEPVCYRPSEESCWCCLGRYVEQYPATSVCVLPRGEKPIADPPMCEEVQEGGDA